MDKIAYEGISWTIGSTSFRTKELNKKTEWQLELLENFWAKPENKNQSWKANEPLQQQYYKFLWESNFTVGNAPRPAKDAREKTSGLCDIGVADRETRKLTEVGKELLKISKIGNFKSDNILQIEADSFLYLKQLLKTSVNLGNSTVRPFVILARTLNELEYLTSDEFIYFLPLISDENSFLSVITKIKDFRACKCDIIKTVYEILLSHKSYQQAHELFLNANSISENLIITVMMNRKSPQYSKPFYEFYKALHTVLMENDFSEKSMKKLENSITNCKTTRTSIRKLLYATTKNVVKGGKKTFKTDILNSVKDEKSFKELFFKICHVAKTLNNLEDYGDLNLRYFTMSDCLITKDKTVKFDTLPKIYFAMVKECLKELSFTACDLLYKSINLNEIAPELVVNTEEFYKNVAKEIGIETYDRKEIQKILDKERYERFNKLLEEKFTDEKLLLILDNFKNRKTSNDEYDEEIKKLVSSNSDGPTSFEYILAVIWYKISDYQGDVLTYMNLSLDADLLPKTHAGGGEADIVWKYEETSDYPKHDLLIEATLSDSTNQRRMEMEPVSRHLGEYLCENKTSNAYCIFLTNYLNMNVISDFRMRRNQPYYGNNGDKVSGMNIAPMETDLLKVIIQTNLKYKKLYDIINKNFESSLEPKEWYEEFEKEIEESSLLAK